MTRMRFAVSLFALAACAAPPADPVNAGTDSDPGVTDADPGTDPTDGSENEGGVTIPGDP